MAQIGDFVTLDRAAKKLGISYWALWRRIRKGDVPTIKIGRSILVRLEDVRAVTTASK